MNGEQLYSRLYGLKSHESTLPVAEGLKTRTRVVPQCVLPHIKVIKRKQCTDSAMLRSDFYDGEPFGRSSLADFKPGDVVRLEGTGCALSLVVSIVKYKLTV